MVVEVGRKPLRGPEHREPLPKQSVTVKARTPAASREKGSKGPSFKKHLCGFPPVSAGMRGTGNTPSSQIQFQSTRLTPQERITSPTLTSIRRTSGKFPISHPRPVRAEPQGFPKWNAGFGVRQRLPPPHASVWGTVPTLFRMAGHLEFTMICVLTLT